MFSIKGGCRNSCRCCFVLFRVHNPHLDRSPLLYGLASPLTCSPLPVHTFVMTPSLVRAFVAHPTSLVQRSFRSRICATHPPAHLLLRHVASRTALAISGGRRCLSGTPGRGAGEGNFGDDIADLNAEIEGFVGDLGDPDFDTTAPSGEPTNACCLY